MCCGWVLLVSGYLCRSVGGLFHCGATYTVIHSCVLRLQILSFYCHCSSRSVSVVAELVLQSIILYQAASSPLMENPIHWFSFTLSDPTCCIVVISQRITRELTGDGQRLSRLHNHWVWLDEINTVHTCGKRNQHYLHHSSDYSVFLMCLLVWIHWKLLTGSSCQQQHQSCREHGWCWSWTDVSSSVLSLTHRHTLHFLMSHMYLHIVE